MIVTENFFSWWSGSWYFRTHVTQNAHKNITFSHTIQPHKLACKCTGAEWSNINDSWSFD